ncbi:MAG: hypothetical protein QXQ94_07650 [Candidatus Bathyarchaeia archaeon]
MRRRIKEKRVYEQKRIDEQSLYYIVERDLDREAIFEHHDGWYSQVPFGKGKRIDYVVRYGTDIYGIEVKKGFPTERDFKQAERYLSFFNGMFLAYPSDAVGQAVYLSELKESLYPDIGLISLTLFRSHIIRRAKRKERQHEQIWKTQFDDEYLNPQSWKRIQLDRLPETVLEDGGFWVTFNRGYQKTENLTKLSFTEADWKGLAILYGAHYSTSFHKYFSINDLNKNYYKDIGWKGIFSLEKLELSNLAVSRSYGTLDSAWSLSDAAFFFIDKVRKAIKTWLGKSEWETLNNKISEWKNRHKENQEKHKHEIIEE